MTKSYDEKIAEAKLKIEQEQNRIKPQPSNTGRIDSTERRHSHATGRRSGGTG